MDAAEMFTHGETPELDEVLPNREQRVQFIEELLGRFPKSCVISLECNTPGPIKSNGGILVLFDYGENRIHEILSNQNWQPDYQERPSLRTGPGAFWVIPKDSFEVERNIVLFEEEKLGRLFDADVLDQKDKFMRARNRVGPGYKPKRHLICDRDTRVCASRRLRPVPMLQQRLTQLLAESARELEKNRSTQ